MAQRSKAEIDEDKATAMRNLRKAFKPGDTVYFVVTHVSKSGMSRSIEFYRPCVVQETAWLPDGSHKCVRKLAIERVTWEFSRVLGYRIDQRNGGIVVGGCGMDMGFHCVYNVGRMMWPKGTRNPHGRRNGEPDSDGGYALKSRQM